MRILVTALALASVFPLSSAMGADLITSEPTPQVTTTSDMDVASFYLGVSGGYGAAHRSGCYDLFGPTPLDCSGGGVTPIDYGLTGALLGAQAGVDFRLTDNFFVGLEVNGAMTNISGDPDPGAFDGGTGTYDWIATGTGRIGFAIDQFKLYGKGGVALTHFTFQGNTGCDFTTTATAPTAGIGASFDVTDHVSIFGEYDRVWQPQVDTTCLSFFGPTAVNTGGPIDIFKVGANYNF